MSMYKYIYKAAELESLMSVLDDIPFLYHRLFSKKKDEQQIPIQPHIRGMSVPIGPQLNKLSELLGPQNIFRQSKNTAVPLPKPRDAKIFKAPAVKSAAATYEWQGQEVIEAKTLQEGGGTQSDPTSVQKLQAQRQLDAQYAQVPPNIVSVLKQYLETRKNNDNNWDPNGNKVK